ncbi:hypothetical protein IVB57_18095 [Bradyrhizobium sp. CW9]|uniref:hypothetical protein n=1 Tax=Bradyrhizobium sp. CW9 TaxID=2782689 RepID=UPI001FF78233|nr:hypothetical protein [Bradyrhizobium sp. CW9]MCK1330245.1 hypothetical protein [Bradyrhizobium sp. CW9]
MLSISETPPLRHLLSRIGYSTHRFNTILVGLKTVADGMGDGGAIAVTWTKPRNKNEAESAASSARSFACSGAMVLAVDVLDAFLRELAEQDWLKFKPETVRIATKAHTRPKAQGGAYSVAERAEALADDLGIDDSQTIALIELFAKWRNVVAHNAERVSQLEDRFRKKLEENSTQIGAGHSHFSVTLGITNFEKRAIPVPKEVTSLMANAVRFARAVDEAAIKRVASTSDEVQSAADWLLSDWFKKNVDIAHAMIADGLQGPNDRRVKSITKWLANAGVSNSKNAVSATLAETYRSDLAALSKKQFCERLGIQLIEAGR